MRSTKNKKSSRFKSATHCAIERGFGLLKRQSGDKPFSEELAEHKRRETQINRLK